MATNPEEKEEKQKEVEQVKENNLNDLTKSLVDQDALVHK